jgi:uncharacterized membrane protein YjjP (DUF1212 family)
MTQSATPLRGGSAAVVDLMLLAATLLFVNGQTTARTIDATARLAGALGFRADLLARWGELTATIDGDDSRASVVSASPLSVDMGKVAATLEVTDQLCDGHIDADGAQVALQAIQHRPPIALARFASLAAAGAAALGVIFGEVHLLGLIVIALSAGAGALLRRWLAGISANPFVQPLCAALLAGAVGAVVVNLQLSTMQRLVAVCPRMVLVPGPHLLNGAIDLARARIALGAARILYAGLIIVVICTGLLVGLALGGVALPVSETSVPVPLPYDVIAAGVAVAAYGTFFSMTWRTLPIPIVTGMIAHAARWATISLGGSSVETGAFVACLFVGIVITPVADRLRLPFAAFAFASVVSSIPGVFLFQMGGGLVALAALGGKAPPELLLATIADGSTATLIMLAMAFGLILPKMIIEHVCPDIVTRRRF